MDYQIVDDVPFETDITPYIKSREQVQLAVRITDAGGNHDWRDVYKGQDENYDEAPMHKVYISKPFKIGLTEVTNAQ